MVLRSDPADPNKHGRSIWFIVGTDRLRPRLGSAKNWGRQTQKKRLVKKLGSDTDFVRHRFRQGPSSAESGRTGQSHSRPKLAPKPSLSEGWRHLAERTKHKSTGRRGRPRSQAARASLPPPNQGDRLARPGRSGQRALDACRRHRQGAQAFAGQPRHSVGDCRCHGSHTGLAHARRRSARAHDAGVDLGHVGHA